MPTITLNLTDQVTTDYATFWGWTDDGTISLEDFVTSKILDRIQNDVTEKANRDAIAGVVPIADVTSDLKQTQLREAMAVAVETNNMSTAPGFHLAPATTPTVKE